MSFSGKPKRLFNKLSCLIFSTLTVLTLVNSAEGGVKVLVPEGRKAALSPARLAGGRLIADRGSYLVYELPESVLSRLRGEPGILPRPDFDRIELNRRVIDTRKRVPDVPLQMRSSGSGERLMLIQFSAPPVDSDLALITRSGARIVQYVPQNAYIVWSTETEADKLEKIKDESPSVQFLGEYHPYYALSPRLDGVRGRTEPVEITVQLFNYGPGARKTADLIARDAVKVIAPPREALRGKYINVRLAVPGDNLAGIAALPGVVFVEPYQEPVLFGERQDQTLAGNLNPAETQPSGPGYLAWLASRSFPTSPSEYPIIDVVDDGFDNGNAAGPANSEFRQLNNPANPSRVEYAVIAAGASGISSPNGVGGHGNINCSIVGGYNNGTGTPANQDSDGYHYGLGVSPYGRIASTKLFSDSGYWGYPNEATMISNQYTAGVRVTSNSWGAAVYGDYNTDAQSYDGWTRDAQSGTPGNQEMLFIFSAGNSGSSGGSIGSPGTAKNIVTVGASENYSQFGTDGCGIGNSGADNIQDIIYFSSRGPCDDGRVKPELVGPGTHVHGAASYDPAYNGNGVCDQYNPPGQTKYAESSGTSHSAPAVAGCASLIFNFLNRIYSISNPSPALVKAYLIHAGRHLTGAYANDDLPSNDQGFGMVNLDLAFNQSASRSFIDQSEILTASGQTYTYLRWIDNTLEPFRATLVWTDPPGPISGNAYVNDLDLEVTVGGTLYLGNNFNLGASVSGGTADVRNNSESVFLPSGLSGSITATVRGTSITGDGVPGNGDLTDQDFALVMYNVIAITPTPSPTPFGYHSPSPTPSASPTPYGYKTVTPTPTATPTTTPTPGPEVIYSFPLNTDPGWSVDPDWAFGQPLGGGSHAGDPSSGYTGSNVYGYNLAGDYPNNLSPVRYLTTTALDCSRLLDVSLRFRRWLGVESSSFDHADIQVSTDGSTWSTVWNHSGSAISESAWSLRNYSLSPTADEMPTVFIRWGMGPTDSSVTYPGWNIDDIEIWGIHIPTPTPTPTPYGYKTPTPTPTTTPTPYYYKTPTPTPTSSPIPTPYSANFPFYDGFESGILGQAWSTFTTAEGRVRVSSLYPYAGTHAALLDDSYDGGAYSTAALTLTADLSRQSDADVQLEFWWREFSDENHPEDGVFVSDDYGGSWARILSFNNGPQSYTHELISLSTMRSYYGFDFNDHFQIKFQFYDNFSITTDGYAIDEVELWAPTTPTPSPSLTPPSSPTPSATPTPTPTAGTPSTTPTPSPSNTPTPTPTCGPIIPPERAVIASGDYDGDGTADIAVFRKSGGMWAVRDITRVYFGSLPDRPVSGDYDGNGTADIAVFRPASGMWAVRGLSRIYYGSGDDFPSPGDYDGDGTCDVTIFRGSAGMWAVRDLTRVYFGAFGDRPVPADFSGNGADDFGIFRGSTGMWAIRDLTRAYFGSAGDWNIPADYDGDGSADVAIFRAASGMWALRDLTRIYYGCCTDWPLNADFNGDGSADVGIFRDSSGLWGIRNISRAYFGAAGDIPVIR